MFVQVQYSTSCSHFVTRHPLKKLKGITVPRIPGPPVDVLFSIFFPDRCHFRILKTKRKKVIELFLQRMPFHFFDSDLDLESDAMESKVPTRKSICQYQGGSNSL